MAERKTSAVVAYAPAEPGKLDVRYESLTFNHPDPGPNEVLVNMLAVGICHSDIVVASVPDGVMGTYPKVLGHEGAGRVETVGSDVTNVQIKALVEDGKINYAVETTGVLSVINACIKSLSKRGKLIQIGVPIPAPTTIVPLDVQDLFDGNKQIQINAMGDCLAKDHVPKMLQWYKDGKFPFDRLIKFYPVKDVAQALEDMKTGVIKPVLVH